MAKNKKFRLQTLLYSRKFLTIFSLIMSIAIWIAVTLNESPIVEKTIKDVKIKIDTSVPEQLGYELFGNKEFTVDVTVKGKRYLVGNNVLKAEDIEVVALTNFVDRVGESELQLKVTPKKSNSGFSIVSTSIDSIKVYFDIPKKVEMTITPKINKIGNLLYSNEYITDDAILSTDKVVISGPATEVNKIKDVEARLEVTNPLKTTQNFPADLVLLDAYGEENHKYLNVETGVSLTITIPVYKKANMGATIDFKNSPGDYIKNSLGIKATPTRINIAAPENVIQGVSNISVGTVDFSQIDNKENVFNFDKKDIKKFKLLSNIDGVKIQVDASEMDKTRKTINTSNISFINYQPGFVVNHSQNRIFNVTIIGPKSELDNLKEANIAANIDLEDITLNEGKQTITVPIILSNDKCWIYGTYRLQIFNEKD